MSDIVRAADLLAAGRAEAGLSQLDTAVCYGVEERTYRRWERGQNEVRFMDLHALVTQVFDLDFAELYKTVEGKACHK
ncbi:helix-turn-helix domain-containing protein [Pseudoalteromonas rubra]|uniref:helix-turn-helix domain-containing protein n=1 Tax=Pseudoalteromonas rubra TaxID=43658 RepID=UPI000F774725|nr:helix-turn-helix transcriptional regulator [Pseudoalteromonas rubra]